MILLYGTFFLSSKDQSVQEILHLQEVEISEKEIDWVEERGGQLLGYEFKWKDGTIKAPALWRKAYPQSSFEVIHPENYLDFIA